MRILIVDDEENVCDVIEDALSNKGYEVFRAYDGKEAFKRVYTVSPDLMILDVAMPKMNGYEVCEKIRKDKFYKNLPILMLSGKKEKEDVTKGFDSGTNGYLCKPFKVNELLGTIELLLNNVSDN